MRIMIDTNVLISAVLFDLNPDEFPGIRDKDDMPILASAVVGDVDVLITGDKDFFDLHIFSDNNIELPLIVTPREFMEKFI